MPCAPARPARPVGAVRPSWRTLRRPRLDGPVAAIAAVEGRCPLCPEQVEVDDEVALLGAALAEGQVDLADAEWGHMRCVLADRYGG